MRIVITGNSGYIGPIVAKHLRSSYPGCSIAGFDTGFFSHCLANSAYLPETLIDVQYYGDMREFPSGILDGVDAVVHLAAISNDPMGKRFEAVTDDVNFRASAALAEEAKKHGVKSFVFASSCSMYGYAEGGPRREEDSLNPLTAYARSKVATESAIARLASDSFIVTALRFSTACGFSPRVRLDLVLNDFVASALKTGEVLVLSDGTPWRPLIDVKDMAKAIDWAIGREAASGGAFLAVNVGDDSHNFRVRDLAEAVAKAIPGTRVSINNKAPPDKRSYRVSFAKYRMLAPQNFPLIPLGQTINELVDGLSDIPGLSSEIRDSQFIRLKVLSEHIENGRLDETLHWRNLNRGTAEANAPAEGQRLREEILSLTSQYCRTIHLKTDPFIPGKTKVNYAGRNFDEKELINLVDSSLEFWLTWGRYSKRFEHDFAEFLGVNWAYIVNSGSSANLLAFMALTSPLLGDRRIQRGDEVITVATGFPTTVSPIVQFGAIPVFVDVELQTANIDCALLETALSVRTKAVMIAHTLGNPFDVDRVKSFCEKHGLWLVEDNCDALGSKYSGRYTGCFGDIATSSFYPPHHMTMGEGGAVYTNNPLLRKAILSLRDWGRDCWCDSGHDNTCGSRFSGQFGLLPRGYDHKFVYSHLGYNLKATDMQAAIGCAQLEKLPYFIEKRRANFDYLLHDLRSLPLVKFIEAYPKSEPSWFGFLITLDDGAPKTRNDIVRYLDEKKIQTRNLFAGNLIRHPCFVGLKEGMDYRIASPLTNTDKLMNDSFWIGVHPGMTTEMLAFMVKSIKEAMA